MLAFGYNNMPQTGYIKVNGQTAVATQFASGDVNRGVTTGVLNIQNSCTLESVMHFDTCANASYANQMASYIQSLSNDTVLVAVSADDAAWSMSTAGVSTLAAIGADITGLEFRGKFAFVAVIGRPEETAFEMQAAYGNKASITAVTQGKVLTKLLS